MQPNLAYPKTAKNIINDRKKKNISKKTRSNITYLTEISKMETDDDYFAMSEIKRIDTKSELYFESTLFLSETFGCASSTKRRGQNWAKCILYLDKYTKRYKSMLYSRTVLKI